MKILIFEDEVCQQITPLCATRLAHDVCMATHSLKGCLELAGHTCNTFSQRQTLSDCFGVNNRVKPASIFINARCIPDSRAIKKAISLIKKEKVGTGYFSGDELALAHVDANHDTRSFAKLTKQLTRIDYPGLSLWRYPHDVIDAHEKLIGPELTQLVKTKTYKLTKQGLMKGHKVKIHPSAVLDTADGPICLGDHTVVSALAYLKGPLFVGKNALITEGAKIYAHNYIGNHCKIGGEVESSIIHDFSNKRHHGFLGHSVVGSWVNIGAGTSNSNLKNTYGIIHMDIEGGRVSTNRQFMGCVIGDFSKTAINTSIFTGKSIGVNSHVYGIVDKNVPDFINFHADGKHTEFNLEAAIRTFERMATRRDIKVTTEHQALLREVFTASKSTRRKFLGSRI